VGPLEPQKPHFNPSPYEKNPQKRHRKPQKSLVGPRKVSALPQNMASPEKFHRLHSSPKNPPGKKCLHFRWNPKIERPLQKGPKKIPTKKKVLEKWAPKTPLSGKKFMSPQKAKRKTPSQKRAIGRFSSRVAPHVAVPKNHPSKNGVSSVHHRKKIPQKRPGKKASKERGTTKKPPSSKSKKTQKSPFQNISEKSPKKPWRPKKSRPKKMVSLQKKNGIVPKKIPPKNSSPTPRLPQ